MHLSGWWVPIGKPKCNGLLFTSPWHSSSVSRSTMKIEDCGAIDPSQPDASKITGMCPCYHAVWPRNKKRKYREWQRKELGREVPLSVWDVPVHTLLKRNYFSSCLKWVTQCKASSSLFISITESFRQSLEAFCPCWSCYVLWRSWGWRSENSWPPERLVVATLAIFLFISHF